MSGSNEMKAATLSALLSAEALSEVDIWVAKYPPEQKQSAVMGALTIAQEFNKGQLTNELMDAIADYLDMSNIAVYEVATFYSMYNMKPVGRNVVNLCTNVSCQLRGADELADFAKQKLGINWGETTPDGRITLREVECQAACCGAPMACINKDYHENLDADKLSKLLDSLE